MATTGATGSRSWDSATPELQPASAQAGWQGCLLCSRQAIEVECINKGKSRQPYEFGVKVSVMTTHKEGLVAGMRSLRSNPYDGHTLAPGFGTGGNPDAAATEGSVLRPGTLRRNGPGRDQGLSPQTRAQHYREVETGYSAAQCLEPAIRRMKNDDRFRGNWLQGTEGDAFHFMPCSAVADTTCG